MSILAPPYILGNNFVLHIKGNNCAKPLDFLGNRGDFPMILLGSVNHYLLKFKFKFK